jgi:protein-disulfide isomerase
VIFRIVSMKFLSAARCAAVGLALLSSAATSFAITPAEKQEIVDEVVQHFMDHPDLILKAIAKWKQDQAARMGQAQIAAQPPQARIVDAIAGNPQGDIVLMDFADFGCKPCNELSSTIAMLASKSSRIKIVQRDLPLSGDAAKQASIDLLSTARIGKDWQTLKSIYLKQGIDPETRIAALYLTGAKPSEGDRQAASAVIEQNRSLALQAGIDALPAAVLVIGNKVVKISGEQAQQQLLTELGRALQPSQD